MADKHYLYLVRITGGTNHPEWLDFFKNVTRLNAKASDYSGINSTCVLRHHADAQSVRVVCTEDMQRRSDVTVEEITRKTLEERHAPWRDLVERYFLPHGSFPNL